MFDTKDRVLLAVSGGVDSVVLADLFQQSSFQFGIAHCNFQLRGKDADQDEQLVRELASQAEVDFFSTAFDTGSIAQQQKKGIQEVARDLRYTWLKQLSADQNFDYVATAHHLSCWTSAN